MNLHCFSREARLDWAEGLHALKKEHPALRIRMHHTVSHLLRDLSSPIADAIILAGIETPEELAMLLNAKEELCDKHLILVLDSEDFALLSAANDLRPRVVYAREAAFEHIAYSVEKLIGKISSHSPESLLEGQRSQSCSRT